MGWSDDLIDFLQVGDLDPNGIIIGIGDELPPPLDTYLESGIVWKAEDNYAYIGIHNNAGSFRVETGFVTDVGNILPVITMFQLDVDIMEYRFVGNNVVTFMNSEVHFEDNFVFFDGNTAAAPGGQDVILNDTEWLFSTAFGDLDINAKPGHSEVTANGWDWALGSSGSWDSRVTMHALGLTDPPDPFTLGIAGTGFVLGNGVRRAQQQVVGGRNYVDAEFIFGATSNQGTSGWTISGFLASLAPPAGIANSGPVGWWYYIRPASTARSGGPILMPAGGSTVSLQVGGAIGAPAAFSQVGINLPEAWVAGAIVRMTFDYPIAV